MNNLTVGQFYLLSIYAIAMNSMDVATTVLGLSLGGTEMNPIMAGNIMLVVKLLAISMYVALLNHIYVTAKSKVYKYGCTLCVLIIATIFTVTVINNILVILTLVK